MNFHNVFKYFANSTLDRNVLEQVSNLDVEKELAQMHPNHSPGSIPLNNPSSNKGHLMYQNEERKNFQQSINSNLPTFSPSVKDSLSAFETAYRPQNQHHQQQLRIQYPLYDFNPAVNNNFLSQNGQQNSSIISANTSNVDPTPLLDDFEKEYLKDFLESIKSESLCLPKNGLQLAEPPKSLDAFTPDPLLLEKIFNSKKNSIENAAPLTTNFNSPLLPTQRSYANFFALGKTGQFQRPPPDFIPFVPSEVFQSESKHPHASLTWANNNINYSIMDNFGVPATQLTKLQSSNIHNKPLSSTSASPSRDRSASIQTSDNSAAQNKLAHTHTSSSELQSSALQNGGINPFGVDMSQAMRDSTFYQSMSYNPNISQIDYMHKKRRNLHMNTPDYPEMQHPNWDYKTSSAPDNKRAKLDFSSYNSYSLQQPRSHFEKINNDYPANGRDMTQPPRFTNQYLGPSSPSNIEGAAPGSAIQIKQESGSNQTSLIPTSNTSSKAPLKRTNKKNKKGPGSNTPAQNITKTGFGLDLDKGLDMGVEITGANELKKSSTLTDKSDSKSPLGSTPSNEENLNFHSVDSPAKSRKHLDEESKRLNHVASERRRRGLIKSYFTELTRLVSTSDLNTNLNIGSNFGEISSATSTPNTRNLYIDKNSNIQDHASNQNITQNQSRTQKSKQSNTKNKMSKAVIIEKAYEYIIALKLENDQLQCRILEKAGRV